MDILLKEHLVKLRDINDKPIITSKTFDNGGKAVLVSLPYHKDDLYKWITEENK